MRYSGTLVLLAILGACGETTGPSAESAQVVDDVSMEAAYPRQDFDFRLEACTEFVDVTGYVVTVQADRQNPNDHFLQQYILNAQGTGVGVSSGAQYRFHDQYIEVISFQKSDAESQVSNNYTTRMTFVGQGTTPNLTVYARFHFMQNHHGEPTAGVSEMAVVCK